MSPNHHDVVTKLVLGASLLTATLLAAAAAAAPATDLPTVGKTGIIVKVAPLSDRIIARARPDAESDGWGLSFMRPYIVLEQSTSHLKITEVEGARSQKEGLAGRVGFVRTDEVEIWPTLEVLQPSALIHTATERSSIEAWPTDAELGEFLRTGDRKAHPPAFAEVPEVSRRRADWVRPYLVLAKKKFPTVIGREKFGYQALFPSYLRPDSARVVVKGSKEQVAKALSSVTFVLVFDATGSMQPYQREVVEALEAVIRRSAEGRDLVRVGFVLFKDEGDAVPLEIVAPRPVDAALRDFASREVGGGGDAAEPVLDALVAAASEFPWADRQGIAGSRKIAVVVLNSDAKTQTIGLTAGKTGLTMKETAELLLSQGVTAITFQAGPEAGPQLVPTLQFLAEATGGSFAQHTTGDAAATQAAFGNALTRVLTDTAAKERETGSALAAAMIPEGAEVVSLPLQALGPDGLKRVEELGGRVNVGAKGGFVATPGWLPERDDQLIPEIQVTRADLETVIAFFSVLGAVEADATDFTAAAAKNLSAIIGEEVPADADLATLVARRTGIAFQTDLLAYPLQYYAGLTPTEKEALRKRMGDAADKLTAFVEANMAELDRQPHVFMPLAYLP